MPRLSRTAPLLLAALFLLCAGEASAGCQNPGQTCGVFGGSCCSGSTCVVGVCVANCAGEGGLCVSSGNCCGSNVCALGFCQRPRTAGQACGPGFPCASGLVCDPLAGFVCVSQTAGLGDACGPLVQCGSGLVCDPLAGFVCVSQTAGLGDACGPLVQCGGGLVCDPLAGFVCVEERAGPGEACGPLVPCEEGLFCDPISGFTCVDQRSSLGEGCGPLVPCLPGLVCDPIAGFVCVDQSVGSDAACGPLVQCDAGLFCDPLAGFRCVPSAGVDDACGPGVPCSAGLHCTSAFRCSHDPGLAGETCGVGFGCDADLFCQLGLPSRCESLRRPGEGCSAFNPCRAGLSCEACFVNGCNAPFQCFQNRNQGAITEQQCRALYSSGLHQGAEDLGLAMTYAAGDEIAVILGESQSFGVVYGADGRFGCFTTLCGGLNADVSIEAFATVGFYETFDDVGGFSFANFQEAQVPGNLVNFATSQVFSRQEGEIIPANPELIGTEDSLAVGVGPNILPFSAGSFVCATVLDTVIDPKMAPPPAPLAVAPLFAMNSSFPANLAGWACSEGAFCAWVDDDALGTENSGSGEVTSPPDGAAALVGILESSCLRVNPSQPTEVSVWAKTLGALAGEVAFTFYPGLHCDGAPLSSSLLGASPPDDQWRSLRARVVAPAGAQSARASISAQRDAETQASSTSRIDTLLVPEPNSRLGALAILVSLALLRRTQATGPERNGERWWS